MQTEDSIRSERPIRQWITILIIAVGFLCPIITYHRDGLLRFDVGIFLVPDHWVGGVLEVLRIQAWDQAARVHFLSSAAAASVIGHAAPANA